MRVCVGFGEVSMYGIQKIIGNDWKNRKSGLKRAMGVIYITYV